MNKKANSPQIQAFLDLLNTRIARKEELKANQTDYRIRDLLETEIAELYVIRNEYIKMYSELLNEKTREATYVSERMELLRDVFKCMDCGDKRGLPFVRRHSKGPFFRFPPVIGATKDVSVLFIGINPRIAPGNEGLHQFVSDDMTAFTALAENRINGRPYIAIDGEEGHYRWHARMINNRFPNRPFEEVAAVTELYFCASINASGLNRQDNPCAKKYMERVLTLVQPRVVVAVGKAVEKYLRRFEYGPSNNRFFVVKIGNHTTTVLPVPHPNARVKRLEKWELATTTVKSVLDGQPDTLPQPSSDRTIIHRNCEWHNRYGWKPFQRPADLDALETALYARIEFQLTRNGKIQFILSMTADQWKAALGRYYNGPNWRRNGYAVSLTRSCSGRPVAEFVTRWKPYIRKMNHAQSMYESMRGHDDRGRN